MESNSIFNILIAAMPPRKKKPAKAEVAEHAAILPAEPVSKGRKRKVPSPPSDTENIDESEIPATEVVEKVYCIHTTRCRCVPMSIIYDSSSRFTTTSIM